MCCLLWRNKDYYLSAYGLSHPAFTSQPQSIIALWPLLILRFTQGRSLSLRGWLVKLRGTLSVRGPLPIPVLLVDDYGLATLTAYNSTAPTSTGWAKKMKQLVRSTAATVQDKIKPDFTKMFPEFERLQQ